MKAFPCKAYVQDKTGVCGISEYSGMDLRDYFAAKAMQGILTLDPVVLYRTFKSTKKPLDQAVAISSYEFADAMIKAREK